MMDAPDILESTEAGVRTITLNRPQQLNSLTAAMLGHLTQALDRAAADSSVRCVVLRLLAELSAQVRIWVTPPWRPIGRRVPRPRILGRTSAAPTCRWSLRLRNMPVPTLAVVHGVAAGAGANVALGCDL